MTGTLKQTAKVMVRCSEEERILLNAESMRHRTSQQKLAHACLFDIFHRWKQIRRFIFVNEGLFRNEHGQCKLCHTFARVGHNTPWPHALDCLMTQLTGFVPGQPPNFDDLPEGVYQCRET